MVDDCDGEPKGGCSPERARRDPVGLITGVTAIHKHRGVRRRDRLGRRAGEFNCGAERAVPIFGTVLTILDMAPV